MLISDALKLAMAVNLFWVLVALFLNHRWYKYSTKMNDEWADFCDNMYREIEDYYKGDENNSNTNGQHEWCSDCKEYDKERHCCPRWNSVIRNTVDELSKDSVKGENNE